MEQRRICYTLNASFSPENESQESVTCTDSSDLGISQPSRLEENRAFCGKSMKLGTHVYYTKTSKYSYSAKPDYACGGCGGHFPKWPPSHKLRGTEPSISTIYMGFVRRRFQKNYCQMYHTILSDIVKVILQNGGHFQSITSISETKRRRASNVDSMYRFCGA